MIKDKHDLQEYLAADKLALRRKGKRPKSNVTIAGIPAKIINEKGVKGIIE